MGLDADILLFLAGCKSEGVSFENTLTIGHQQRLVDDKTVARVFRHIGCFDEALYRDLVAGKSGAYADEIFRMFGARQVDSLDYSAFEGAMVIQDLNKPLADQSLRNKYDLIYDGGTIEHIFNCQVALKTYMELCRPGGSLVITAPANNWMGHGFYQLGPDFYFRTLCPENGFRVRRLIITPLGPFKRWYEVSDPKDICERVELISFFRQMMIMVHAVKTEDKEIMELAPQQQSFEAEDYDKMRMAREQNAKENSFWGNLARKFPVFYANLHALRTAYIFYTTLTIGNRKKFKPVPMWPDGKA